MVASVHEENGERDIIECESGFARTSREDGYQHKVNDDGELPTKNNFHFIPFIVENHGFIHPQSLKLLEVLAAKAEFTWRLKQHIYYIKDEKRKNECNFITYVCL
jgi:hypothetical protein